jgi:hypothetical protein
LLEHKLEHLELIAQVLFSNGDAALDRAVPNFHLKKSTALNGERENECLKKHFPDA